MKRIDPNSRTEEFPINYGDESELKMCAASLRSLKIFYNALAQKRNSEIDLNGISTLNLELIENLGDLIFRIECGKLIELLPKI